MKRHMPRIAALGTKPGNRRPLRVFLMESDIKLLVFVGKCMDYFGMGAVAGFLLGATAVYAYALVFQQLPYAVRFNSTALAQPIGPAVPIAPPRPEKIRIQGVVTTDGKNAVKEAFQVGLVEVVSGEFTNGDGKYHLEVPKQGSYKLAFWKPNYENMRVLEVAPDDEGKVDNATWLPRDIAMKVSPDNGPTNSRIAERVNNLRRRDPIVKVENLNRTLGIIPERYHALRMEE